MHRSNPNMRRFPNPQRRRGTRWPSSRISLNSSHKGILTTPSRRQKAKILSS